MWKYKVLLLDLVGENTSWMNNMKVQYRFLDQNALTLVLDIVLVNYLFFYHQYYNLLYLFCQVFMLWFSLF